MGREVQTIKVREMSVNPIKTEELLAGLKDEGVNVGVENLTEYIRKQGLIIKIHCGRKRLQFEADPKMYGVDISSKGEDVIELFRNHLKKGTISFIPKEDERRLTNIDSGLRMTLKRMAIGYDGSFISFDDYAKFKESYETAKQAYLEARDNILLRWDALKESFKNKMVISLKELNALEQNELISSILAKIPTPEEYGSSFYLKLGVRAFPIVENLDVFDDEVQAKIKEDIAEDTYFTVHDMVANTLNDAFEAVVRIIVSAQKGEGDAIAYKTVGSVKSSIKRIAKKNIFNNEKINEIKDGMVEMLTLTNDCDGAAEKAETLLAKIYAYAKDLDMEIDLSDCPLSENDLVHTYEHLVA